ncbi:ionic transporter y4hA [Azorhizobium caulinodans]|uniref:calcium:proton antiporter n=1 Tax=Azorhizobium caulinodans TaxID=7 RepID=UPI002FBE0C3C
MAADVSGPMPKSAWLYPIVALGYFGLATGLGFDEGFTGSMSGILLAIVLIPVIFGAIFAAVYHAEVIGHATGEPFGTLVLTAAVTIIEVALIASVMLSDDGGSPELARDTVFSVVMTVCTGLTGICILGGGLRFKEQVYETTGAGAYLTVLIVLVTLTLVLPNYTQGTPGPFYSSSQLAFFSVLTLILYGVFLYIQMVRHRDYFVSSNGSVVAVEHAIPTARALLSAGLLFAALTAIVLLSKKFAIVVEAGREAVGSPPAVTGLIVAILILLPESIPAFQAARRDQLQKSLNLALGSSLATIGMTFPAVAVVSLALNKPLVLGLTPRDTVLMATTLLVSSLTLGSGRTNILYGFTHLVIFAAFLFLTFQP